MGLTIKLDCDLEDQVECNKHRGAMMAALMMFNTYCIAKEDLFGIGPELYAEQWMSNHFRLTPREFEDLVLIYFVKFLLVSQK